jgi:nicotinamidase-related amidase
MYAASILRACATSACPPSSSSLAKVGTIFKTWAIRAATSAAVFSRSLGLVLKITKRQWGAFYGTELDLQLRRRGIRTIVLGGVATQIGVESTARQAYEHGYELLIVKDVTTSTVAEGHDMSMKHILPRLGRLVESGDILTRS